MVLSTTSGAQREKKEVDEVDTERDRAGGSVGGLGAFLLEKAIFDVRGNGFETVA